MNRDKKRQHKPFVWSDFFEPRKPITQMQSAEEIAAALDRVLSKADAAVRGGVS